MPLQISRLMANAPIILHLGGAHLFIKSFVAGEEATLGLNLDRFLDGLNTQHPFGWAQDNRDLPTGTPSKFLDIYPTGLVDKYDSFGLVYVRIWLVGKNPSKIILGIFLGAARAEQAEPRRAAEYVRSRLGDVFDSLERARGFAYKTWGDADIWWRTPDASVRAVTRQFEQFMTYRISEIAESDLEKIENDVAALVQAVDASISALHPLRKFGEDIVMTYYGGNLPTKQADYDASGGRDEDFGGNVPTTTDWFSELPKTPDLGDLKGMQQAYERAIAALASGKHVLLMGAPGVGKTELAEVICRLIRQPYEIVTATSDWSSMQTIGGYMPVPQANSSTEPLDFLPGVFTAAMAANRWLIIDEMNRADIDKAFGEMFTLLGGKRKSVVLPYMKRGDDGMFRRVSLGQQNTETKENFLYALSPSWRLIGTMNTFDKASLFQMSFAFSRRVAVIEVGMPGEQDFQTVLATSAASLFEGDGPLRNAVLKHLFAVFASQSGSGLSLVGLRVGPAIPLDILKFSERMRRFESDPKLLVLAGLEMYLFPQFEGRHESNGEIAAALASALGLNELPLQTMSVLRTFTGAIA